MNCEHSPYQKTMRVDGTLHCRVCDPDISLRHDCAPGGCLESIIRPTIQVSAIWLRRIGKEAQVLAEIDGEWRIIIREFADNSYSWIAEARAAHLWPLDDLDAEPERERV